MKRTYIIQGVGVMQFTVCDCCGEENTLTDLRGWSKYLSGNMLKDICQACLTTRALDLRESAPSQALPTPEVYPLAEVAQLPPANQ